jgi:2,3-bisphosphoglycerate-independent phosphoglycerate mutase
MPYPSVCLVILDGWGLAPAGPGNAVDLASTPVFDDLWARYPHTQLEACGAAVGLPDGQMGNSEVGHLNLGAGAVVKQDLTRIDEAVAHGDLGANPAIRAAFDGFERVHLIGLVSDGGVHASLEHLGALLQLGAEGQDVVVHAFTDGRDTSPHGGAGYLAQVDAWPGRVGSVIGRYYAMDRDHRAERTQAALDMLVEGRADHHADTGEAAVRAAYARDETDEFITATTVGDEARIRPQDSVLAFNFRPDRMRQLTEALGPKVARYTTLTEYEEGWPWPVAFPPARPETTLAHVVGQSKLKQLHVAETEKYPHVTYFFGGGEEDPEPGERRELVDSPRDVPTYDHKPQMSAHEAAAAFVQAWGDQGGRNRRHVPRRGGPLRAGNRRRARHHGRPRQRRRDARARRLPGHRPLAEPRAPHRHRRRGGAARRRRPGRRGADGPAAARHGAARGDDGPLAAVIEGTVPFASRGQRRG